MDKERLIDINKIKGVEETLEVGCLRFVFSYLNDKSYRDSLKDSRVKTLDIHRLVIANTIDAISDLDVQESVVVRVSVPSSSAQKKFIIPEFGIGANASEDNLVEFYLDSSSPNMSKGVTKMAARTMVHEINHIARRQGGQFGRDLLGRIIYEGLATYYQENWKKKFTSRWGHALTVEEEKNEWAKAKGELDSTDFDYFGWFFSSTNGHPFWTGYSLGTSIIYKYFENNPQSQMLELVRKPSKKILEESGYSS